MKKIVTKKIILLLILFVLLCGFFGKKETPSLFVSINKDLYRGQPLYINMTSSYVDLYEIEWMDKKYNLLPKCEGKSCKAEFLLPTDYNKHGKYNLDINMVGGESYKSTVEVTVHDKEYDKQSLNVDPKYVKIPTASLDRVAKEREITSKILKTNSVNQYWSLPFSKPVEVPVITGAFGVLRLFNGEPRSKHGGLDLRGRPGDPIYAVADGKVLLNASHYFSGNVVYLDHGLGVISVYMHLSAFNVSTGDIVKKGDLLGKAGSTGRVTGPHLHLSLYVQGVSVDPLPLLKFEN